MKTDTVVIGGGIIGCSSAYYLARAGVRVTLIERRGIGEGTSGACDGFVMLQSVVIWLPAADGHAERRDVPGAGGGAGL